MMESLFHNRGNGTFEEAGLESGVAVDGDGRRSREWAPILPITTTTDWPDLFVDDLANQKYNLFRNDGDGTIQ